MDCDTLRREKWATFKITTQPFVFAWFRKATFNVLNRWFRITAKPSYFSKPNSLPLRLSQVVSHPGLKMCFSETRCSRFVHTTQTGRHHTTPSLTPPPPPYHRWVTIWFILTNLSNDFADLRIYLYIFWNRRVLLGIWIMICWKMLSYCIIDFIMFSHFSPSRLLQQFHLLLKDKPHAKSTSIYSDDV